MTLSCFQGRNISFWIQSNRHKRQLGYRLYSIRRQPRYYLSVLSRKGTQSPSLCVLDTKGHPAVQLCWKCRFVLFSIILNCGSTKLVSFLVGDLSMKQSGFVVSEERPILVSKCPSEKWTLEFLTSTSEVHACFGSKWFQSLWCCHSTVLASNFQMISELFPVQMFPRMPQSQSSIAFAALFLSFASCSFLKWQIRYLLW